MPRELGRDVSPGRRMARQVGQQGLADLEAALRAVIRALPVQDLDRTDVVPVRPELEGRGVVIDRETGQDLGGVLHVLLGVARTQPNRVQLEELAAVVLVRVVATGVLVVEVPEHRGALGVGDQQFGEAAKGKTADVLTVLDRLASPEVFGWCCDREMVGPELDHLLEELPVAPDVANDRRLDHVQVGGPLTVVVGRGLVDLLRGPVQRREAPEQVVDQPIADARRVQLLVEPTLDSLHLDVGDQRRGEAERRPPQEVQPLILAEHGRDCAGRRDGRRGCRGGGRRRARAS